MACAHYGYAQTAPDPSRQVQIVFDEQSIQDATRAQVYDLIVRTTDDAGWPRLELKSAAPITSVVNDYYDIYNIGPGRAPASQKLLTDAIAKANPELTLPDGRLAPGTVKLPPVPVRGFSDYGRAPNAVDARVFDPTLMEYELRSSTGGSVALSNSTIPLATANQAARRGKITKVVLSFTDTALNAFQGAKRAVRALLALDDNEGMANVSLLSAQPASCAAASEWMGASPYLGAMKGLFASPQVDKLVAAARNVPLTIIDWNIRDANGAVDPKGHGAKVRAVVSEMLAGLGLQRLDSDEFIKVIELNPARNRAGLKAILAAYKAELVKQSGSDIAKEFVGAEHWVDNHVPLDEYAPQQKVHSLVLQAIFWHQFRQTQAVNLSFTTDSMALKITAPNFMVGSRAFGAFAAGNNGMPVNPRLLPQAEAYQWPTLVNVTHGRADGAIQGDISNEQFKILVTLVAPGCGYTTPPLMTSDVGSSFASPYVLTAAWIRMLQGIPAASLKRALITASRPLPTVGSRVESGGLFDAAQFLLQPRSHLLTESGAYLSLSSIAVDLTYQSDGVGINIKNAPAAEPAHVVSVHPCGEPQVPCAIVRRWNSDGSLWITSGPITSVNFVAVSGQQTISTTDPAALVKLVRLFTF